MPAEAPFARISLTLPRLLRARTILLVATGEDKRRVLRQATDDDTVLKAGKAGIALEEINQSLGEL